jgi:hypothetical protein
LVVCHGQSGKYNYMKTKGNLVALTGIEPATLQFSSVQLGLSSCVFGPVQFATRVFVAVRRADVLPWCCPAAGIRLIAGQSDTVGRLASILSCERNSTSTEYPGPDRSRQRKNALGRPPILVNIPAQAAICDWPAWGSGNRPSSFYDKAVLQPLSENALCRISLASIYSIWSSPTGHQRSSRSSKSLPISSVHHLCS